MQISVTVVVLGTVKENVHELWFTIIEDVFFKRAWEAEVSPVGQDVVTSMYQDGSIFLRLMHSCGHRHHQNHQCQIW